MLSFRTVALGGRQRIAGAVYGTIVVLAVLAAGASAYSDDLWRLAALVSASVLVLWVAHVYAHALGESLRLRRRLTRAELLEILWRELAIPLAALLPIAAIATGALGIVEGATAIWLAFGVGVALLAVQGLRFARMEELGPLGAAASVSVNVGLGLALVVLKVVVAK